MAVERGAKVAVLRGGVSSEREVSLASGAAVAGALRRRGWDVVELDLTPALPQELAAEGVEAVWLALHGRQGEDGCVQGLLEVLGIPYTGSGVAASAIAMDKIATKRMLQGVSGVVMAGDVVVKSAEDPPPAGLRFPVIVKPAVGGSTVGMQVVRSLEQWADPVREALAEHPVVLVEELVEGDEITVAVLDGKPLPVVAIAPADGFFDYEAKYVKGATTYTVPAPLEDPVREAAQAAAVAAYTEIGCRGLARADFLVRAGVPVFLEINTIPGMTETSLSPMAAGASGLPFDALVEHLLLGATTDGAAQA